LIFCNFFIFSIVLEACTRSEIEIHFQHKFIGWNREEKIATFEKYLKKSFHKNFHFLFLLSSSGDHVDFKVDALIAYDG
jgi:hypothetical protein